MKYRFHATLAELLAILTTVAIACVLLINASSLLAYVAVTCEVVLLTAAIVFIPSSTGRTRRFLIAFVATATMYQVFSHNTFYSPFEYEIAYGAWVVQQLASIPSQYDGAFELAHPEDYIDELEAFRRVGRPVLGLTLGIIAGFVSRSIEPKQ